MAFSKDEKSFTIVFCVIVLAELISGNIESLSQIHYITKPLILVSLIIFFGKHSKALDVKTKSILLFALAFSLLGDILLMFVDIAANFFIGGLVAFLLAHIMYILIFLKQREQHRVKPAFIAIVLLYAGGLFYILYPGLGDMLIPVIVYMTAILIMVVSASLRKKSISNNNYNLVFIGALFFMISDSILAVNKFHHPVPLSGILIMTTYATAQYLIVMGMLKQKA